MDAAQQERDLSRINETVKNYNTNEEDITTNVIDIIADLLHWCEKNNQVFDELLGVSYGHFNREIDSLKETNKLGGRR